jgi:nicotinamidase-related amidase
MPAPAQHDVLATGERRMHTALLVIDVQESFRHRPYWSENGAREFLQHVNTLIDGCTARGVPIVRVFHREGPDTVDNPFSQASGQVRPLEGLARFEAALAFEKSRHSALVGTPLAPWLVRHGIRRLIVSGIRTEQCCETTTRHASDEGWEVDYVTDATLTFDMKTPAGAPFPAAQIRERTEAVLAGRFASIATVADALGRAA